MREIFASGKEEKRRNSGAISSFSDVARRKKGRKGVLARINQRLPKSCLAFAKIEAANELQTVCKRKMQKTVRQTGNAGLANASQEWYNAYGCNATPRLRHMAPGACLQVMIGFAESGLTHSFILKADISA